MGLLYKLQQKVFGAIGDTQWFGWKHPFWFAVCPPGYKLKGEHYRLVRPILKPGDILLQRFEGWVDKWFIPGFWNHAAIYLGNPEEQVVHAVSEGVLIEDIINFMRTDHMMILRVKDSTAADEAVKKALSIVGAEYDFNFDFSENKRFACTEVVDYCYQNVFCKSRHFGRTTLTPDDIAYQGNVIWDSRKFLAQWSNTSVSIFSDSKPKHRIMTRTIVENEH